MRVDKPEHKIIHSRQTLVKTARGGSQDFVRQTVNRKMIMNKQQIVDKEFVVQKISMTESTPRQLLFLGDKDQNVGQEKNVVGDNQLSQRKIGMANRKIKSFRISGLSQQKASATDSADNCRVSLQLNTCRQSVNAQLHPQTHQTHSHKTVANLTTQIKRSNTHSSQHRLSDTHTGNQFHTTIRHKSIASNPHLMAAMIRSKNSLPNKKDLYEFLDRIIRRQLKK